MTLLEPKLLLPVCFVTGSKKFTAFLQREYSQNNQPKLLVDASVNEDKVELMAHEMGHKSVKG